MNFRTVDEFENFDFNEAHIGGIEVKSGHVFLYLDNVMISAKNSCNRDIREMRTNELILKLQDTGWSDYFICKRRSKSLQCRRCIPERNTG